MIASSTLDLHEFSLPRPTSSPAPSFMSDRIHFQLYQKSQRHQWTLLLHWTLFPLIKRL